MNLRILPGHSTLGGSMCTGVTFEDGFHNFVYAESHKSKPNLMKKFREAIASYQSEQEQANVVIAQRKKRRSENLRKATKADSLNVAVQHVLNDEIDNLE